MARAKGFTDRRASWQSMARSKTNRFARDHDDDRGRGITEGGLVFGGGAGEPPRHPGMDRDREFRMDKAGRPCRFFRVHDNVVPARAGGPPRLDS